jgi:omega-6 fatty acid desaturase (delta-12 desaturase)
VWGEFVPTLLLVLGSWILCAQVLFPLAHDAGGWWIPVYVLGCLSLALWLVRLFVVQHDAGHNALSPSPTVNNFIGHICSVFEFTPFIHWHRHHWRHHRAAGHLEKQDGLGDIYTLTVTQFQALPRWKQRLYRAIRNRVHFFLIMPANLFLVLHRLPLVHFPLSPIVRQPTLVEWLNILALDAVYAVVGWWTWTHWAVAQPWCLSYLLAFVVAATTGTALFYTQHQFETTYYAHDDEWSFYESSMKGSMTLRLPFVWMEWAIGYINYHSIHHLKPNIPMYNLRRCYVTLTQLGVRMVECRLGDLWRMFSLALWDEEQQRMVSFAEVDAR